jgi:hypothetical protein
MAPAASADRTECVGVLTGTFDNVTVPPGSGLLADECRGAAQRECPRGREALFPRRGDRQQSSGRRSGVRADFTLGAGPPNTVGNNILLAGGSDFVAVCNIQVGRNVLIQEWTARGIVVGEMRSASSSARCSVGGTRSGAAFASSTTSWVPSASRSSGTTSTTTSSQPGFTETSNPFVETALPNRRCSVRRSTADPRSWRRPPRDSRHAWADPAWRARSLGAERWSRGPVLGRGDGFPVAVELDAKAAVSAVGPCP